MKLNYYLLTFLSLIFSCKSTSRISKKQMSELAAVYDSISNNYLDYKTLYIKSSLKYKNEKKSMKLKTSIKILKDSLIIVSLSPGLGIEAARIKFTKDSIYIMDRLSSHLTKASYKYLLDSMNVSVDFADIQAILTNELFVYPKDKSTEVKEQFIYNYSIRSQVNDLLLYRKTASNIEQLIAVDRGDYHVKGVKITEIDKKRYLNIQFIDLFSEDFKTIPKSISIVSFAAGKNTTIDLNYSKVIKNKQLTFSFKVPSKYKVSVL